MWSENNFKNEILPFPNSSEDRCFMGTLLRLPSNGSNFQRKYYFHDILRQQLPFDKTIQFIWEKKTRR